MGSRLQRGAQCRHGCPPPSPRHLLGLRVPSSPSARRPGHAEGQADLLASSGGSARAKAQGPRGGQCGWRVAGARATPCAATSFCSHSPRRGPSTPRTAGWLLAHTGFQLSQREGPESSGTERRGSQDAARGFWGHGRSGGAELAPRWLRCLSRSRWAGSTSCPATPAALPSAWSPRALGPLLPAASARGASRAWAGSRPRGTRTPHEGHCPPAPPAQAEAQTLGGEGGDRPVQRPQRLCRPPSRPAPRPAPRPSRRLTDGPGLIRPCLPEANEILTAGEVSRNRSVARGEVPLINSPAEGLAEGPTHPTRPGRPPHPPPHGSPSTALGSTAPTSLFTAGPAPPGPPPRAPAGAPSTLPSTHHSARDPPLALGPHSGRLRGTRPGTAPPSGLLRPGQQGWGAAQAGRPPSLCPERGPSPVSASPPPGDHQRGPATHRRWGHRGLGGADPDIPSKRLPAGAPGAQEQGVGPRPPERRPAPWARLDATGPGGSPFTPWLV